MNATLLFCMCLLVIALLARRAAAAPKLPGQQQREPEQQTEDGDDEGIALSDLTDDQLNAALDSMTTATLVQIINSQGYDVEEGLSQEKIVQAAKHLVKQERDRQIQSLRSESGGSSGSGGSSRGSSTSSVSASEAPKAAQQSSSGSSSDSRFQSSSEGLDDDDAYDAPRSNSPPKVEGGGAASTPPLQRGATQKESATTSPPAASAAAAAAASSSLAGWTHKQPIPPGATAWECFQAQIMTDLAPLIRLIPAPIQAAFVEHTRVMHKPVKAAVVGALGPMLNVLGRLLSVAGRGLEGLGGEMTRLSQRVGAMGGGEEESVPSRSAERWPGGGLEEDDAEADVIEL